MMNPDDLRKIGRALGGTHWQADVARDISMSKSQITRYLDTSRTPDMLFTSSLRGVMIDKISTIASHLTTAGLPQNKSARTKEALALIKEAVKLLRQED